MYQAGYCMGVCRRGDHFYLEKLCEGMRARCDRWLDAFGSACFTCSFTPEKLADKFWSALALQYSIPRPKEDFFPAHHSLPFAP